MVCGDVQKSAIVFCCSFLMMRSHARSYGTMTIFTIYCHSLLINLFNQYHWIAIPIIDWFAIDQLITECCVPPPKSATSNWCQWPREWICFMSEALHTYCGTTWSVEMRRNVMWCDVASTNSVYKLIPSIGQLARHALFNWCQSLFHFRCELSEFWLHFN